MTLDGIGTRIKALRKKAGLTQSDLAKQMNVSRETVNQWERGARDLKTGTVIMLAEKLSTSCEYMLMGIETCRPQMGKDKFFKLECMATRCNYIEEKLDLLADLADSDEEVTEFIENKINEQADRVEAEWNEYFPAFPLNWHGVLCGYKQIGGIATKVMELLRILEKEVPDD